FYLVAAGAVVLYRRNSPRHVQALWLALGGIFILLFPRALFFVTGVLVFQHRAWFAERTRWLQYPVISLFVFLIAWRATDILMAHLSDTVFDFLLDGRWFALLIAFAASIHLFASLTLNASRQFAFLSGSLFQFLGQISYSFYLWHTLVMSVTKRIFVPPVIEEYGVVAGVVVFAVSSLAIAIPVSWVSWNLFEVRLAGAMKRAFRPQQQLAGTVSDARIQ
ncbi:MAG TPA: acyltransferase family protein, partial [Povalibacter sp.]